MNISNLLKHPGAYIRALKFTLAGWYFDHFMRSFKAEGCEFAVPQKLTTRLGRGYFAFNLYENVERRLISKYISGNRHVLEIGACIGVISCIVNKKITHKDKHVVIEANPTLIPFLEKNKQINNCEFSIANCAISSKPVVEFYFGGSIVSGSILPGNNGAKKVSVVGRSFEEIESQHRIRFDTLIIDIEGAEYLFFSENASNFAQVDLIIIENHPHLLSKSQIDQYEAQLLQSGFSMIEEIETSKVWKRSLV